MQQDTAIALKGMMIIVPLLTNENVFINGEGAGRQSSDTYGTHSCDAHPPHSGTAVFINGKGSNFFRNISSRLFSFFLFIHHIAIYLHFF